MPALEIAAAGSRGSVYLSACDFEYRTVRVWVTPSTGARPIHDRKLREGEEVSFSLAGSYVLRLEDLRDRLIGAERAVFRIREDRAE